MNCAGIMPSVFVSSPREYVILTKYDTSKRGYAVYYQVDSVANQDVIELHKEEEDVTHKHFRDLVGPSTYQAWEPLLMFMGRNF